jgi:hypothetical protein
MSDDQDSGSSGWILGFAIAGVIIVVVAVAFFGMRFLGR